MRFIEIENSGVNIVATNYWKSEEARQGIIICSVNAGCFRLLVPPKVVGIGKAAYVLSEMRTGQIVLISRGFDVERGIEGFDFNFDDNTSTPFYVILGSNQFVTLPLINDGGRDDLSVKIYAYNENKGVMFEALTLPARYRNVDFIPSKDKWQPIKPTESPKTQNSAKKTEFDFSQLTPLSEIAAEELQIIYDEMQKAIKRGKEFAKIVNDDDNYLPIFAEPNKLGLFQGEFVVARMVNQSEEICSDPMIIIAPYQDKFYPVAYFSTPSNMSLRAVDQDASGTKYTTNCVQTVSNLAESWLRSLYERGSLRFLKLDPSKNSAPPTVDISNSEKKHIGAIAGEACSSAETRKQIDALKEYELDVYSDKDGEPITWNDIDCPHEPRTLLHAIEVDRKMRIDGKMFMADRPPFAIATIHDKRIVRLEYYEGHDFLTCQYDLRSLELLKQKLKNSYSERPTGEF